MPRYVVLVNWTDQGIRNVKQTAERTDHGGDIAQKHGLQQEAAYWTVGGYDLVTIFEAPDHDAALQRVRPAIRVADPEMRIVKSDASSLQHSRTASTNGARAHEPEIEATTAPDARTNGARLTQSHVQQRFELS